MKETRKKKLIPFSFKFPSLLVCFLFPLNVNLILCGISMLTTSLSLLCSFQLVDFPFIHLDPYLSFFICFSCLFQSLCEFVIFCISQCLKSFEGEKEIQSSFFPYFYSFWEFFEVLTLSLDQLKSYGFFSINACLLF